MHLQLSTVALAQRPDGLAISLGPRDAALLAWLVLEGPTPRAQLASLLWPESPPEAARNTLRQRLFQLRKQLGTDVVGGQHTLQLAPGVSHDLAHTHPLLADVPLDLGGDYAAWLLRQREQRYGAHLQALQAEADRCEQAGQFDAALAHAQALLRLAPLSEATHRRVMRLHYLAGDRAAALLAFDACEQVLKNEVGTRPSAETLALLRTIDAGQATQGPAQPVALPVSLRRPPRLLGREDTCAQLLQAWHNQQHFLLLGEPGQGKTRLLEHLAERWPGAQLVRARPGDEAVPLALLARLVAQVGQACPTLRDGPAGQALLQALPPQLGAGQAPRRQPPRPLVPLLAAWLAEAGSHGQALLLDDWQFADEASVALLGPWLADAGTCPVRLGVASRTHAGPQAEQRLGALRQLSDLRSVTLPPLDEAAIAALLGPLMADLAANLGADAAEPTELAQALHRRVGGNPLHLLESLRHMVHNRLPLQPRHLAVPRQVRELLAERLAQLPGDARHLLQVAAVAGQDFSVELAEAVTGRHALALAEAWALLEQRGLFGAHGTSHDLYAEVARAQLPGAIAQVLHERVATWLAQRPHEPGRLAAHWRAAGRDAQAVPHLLNAALLAWHAARADETFDFHAQAAQITLAQGQPDQAFAHWFDNAEAMSEIGTAAQSAECLRHLEPLARTDAQALRVQFVRAVLRAAQGDVDAGLSEVGRMLADAVALGDTRIEAECRFAAANRATADGDFDEALQHLAVGERLQRELGNERLATALAATKAMVLGLRGQPRLAQREVERTLPLLAHHNDHATWAVLCSAQALQWLRQGLLTQALEEAQRARDAAERSSIAPMDLLVILRNLVDTFRWAGHFGEALAVGQAFGQRLASQGQFSSAQRTLAGLYLSLGRADLALQQLPPAEPGHTPQLRLRERLQTGLLRVQVALTTGQPGPLEWPQEAWTTSDLALAAEWALWAALPEPPPWPAGHADALLQRLHQAGLQLLAEPLQALAVTPQPTPVPHTGTPPATAPWAALLWARRHWQAGQVPLARSTAARGMDDLQALAAQHVPPAYRESFLQRHPAHLALQAIAARLKA